MPDISPLVRIRSPHTSMVPCIEVYAAQDGAQYRSGDLRISAGSQPRIGLSIRSPALVLYPAPPTQRWSSEYKYLRDRHTRLLLRIAIGTVMGQKGCQLIGY